MAKESDLLEAVRLVVDEVVAVFAALEELGKKLSTGCAASGSEDRRLACGDFEIYRADILGILETFGDLTAGAGLIIAPEVLSDAQRWIDWWWKEPGQPPKQLKVNVNPDSPDSLDYTAEEWFVRPATSGKRSAVGPYVDYLCTNDYTITLSVPVYSARLVAIAAADILVASMEETLLPAFCRAEFPVLLVNELGRVIVSNLCDYPSGCRIEWPWEDTKWPLQERLGEIGSAPELGWTLLGAV